MNVSQQEWMTAYTMPKINYGALKFPKNPPALDKAYLQFIREQICAVYGNDCEGVTEPAHIGTTGRGLKSPGYYTIPLCSKHHREQHSVGVLTFQANHLLNVWEACAENLVRWITEER